ncbi:anti-sigma regulatory factor [Mucilaginibacter sp. S1162]|uniref:Anti-sigma regulatory factor n=1 Tax=Mucilaginibacter humi TaxID=2732510 RepID=A0ABX1W0P5_9SPHI|nr:anti-sigma regulatory factor [Mucilaginibacter humi]NNU33685.1 anti-sigma regulatory factor [Mucilaginibacter humi]
MAIFDIREKNDFNAIFYHIKDLSDQANMSVVKQTQLITAVCELMSNALNYAGHGQVDVYQNKITEKQGVTVVITDTGPGIADLPLAMKDGFSTKNTLGIGLPGAKRLADEFWIESVINQGTCIRITKYV